MVERFRPPVLSTELTKPDSKDGNTSVLLRYAREKSFDLTGPADCSCEEATQHTVVLEEQFHPEDSYPIISAHVPFRLTDRDGRSTDDIDIYQFPYGLTETGVRLARNLLEVPGIETVGFTRHIARVGFAAVMDNRVAKSYLFTSLTTAGCSDLRIGRPSAQPVGFSNLPKF